MNLEEMGKSIQYPKGKSDMYSLTRYILRWALLKETAYQNEAK